MSLHTSPQIVTLSPHPLQRHITASLLNDFSKNREIKRREKEKRQSEVRRVLDRGLSGIPNVLANGSGQPPPVSIGDAAQNSLLSDSGVVSSEALLDDALIPLEKGVSTRESGDAHQVEMWLNGDSQTTSFTTVPPPPRESNAPQSKHHESSLSLSSSDSSNSRKKRKRLLNGDSVALSATPSTQRHQPVSQSVPLRPRRTLNSRLNQRKSLNRQFIQLLDSHSHKNALKHSLVTGSITRILERGELMEQPQEAPSNPLEDLSNIASVSPMKSMKSIGKDMPLVHRKRKKKEPQMLESPLDSRQTDACELNGMAGDGDVGEVASKAVRVPKRSPHFARFHSPSRIARIRSKKSMPALQKSNSLPQSTPRAVFELAMVQKSSPQLTKTEQQPNKSASPSLLQRISTQKKNRKVSKLSLLSNSSVPIGRKTIPEKEPSIASLVPEKTTQELNVTLTSPQLQSEISIRKIERIEPEVPQWMIQLKRRQEKGVRVNKNHLKNQHALRKQQEEELKRYVLKKEQMLREAPPVYNDNDEKAAQDAKRAAYLNLPEDVKRFNVDAQKKDKEHLSFNEYHVYCNAYPNGIKFFHTDVVDPKLKIHLEFVETMQKKESKRKFWDGREHHQLSWYREDLKRMSSSQRMADRYAHLLVDDDVKKKGK
uniref:Uncharacterized protein n=1 Tax=Percolomonas cosmopolitus TaxID=63605 RepID=A0A7S1PI88_9EUKA